MEQSPNASPTRLVDAFWLDWSDDGTVVNTKARMTADSVDLVG